MPDQQNLPTEQQQRILEVYEDIDATEAAQALLEFQRIQRAYLLSDEAQNMIATRRHQFENNMNVIERMIEVVFEVDR